MPAYHLVAPNCKSRTWPSYVFTSSDDALQKLIICSKSAYSSMIWGTHAVPWDMQAVFCLWIFLLQHAAQVCLFSFTAHLFPSSNSCHTIIFALNNVCVSTSSGTCNVLSGKNQKTIVSAATRQLLHHWSPDKCLAASSTCLSSWDGELFFLSCLHTVFNAIVICTIPVNGKKAKT
jgi:hypothetical protein